MVNGAPWRCAVHSPEQKPCRVCFSYESVLGQNSAMCIDLELGKTFLWVLWNRRPEGGGCVGSGRGAVERWTGGQATPSLLARRRHTHAPACPAPLSVGTNGTSPADPSDHLSAACSPQQGVCLQLTCLAGIPSTVFLLPTETHHTHTAPALSHSQEANFVLLTHLHASTELDILNTRLLQPEKRPVYLYF